MQGMATAEQYQKSDLVSMDSLTGDNQRMIRTSWQNICNDNPLLGGDEARSNSDKIIFEEQGESLNKNSGLAGTDSVNDRDSAGHENLDHCLALDKNETKFDKQKPVEHVESVPTADHEKQTFPCTTSSRVVNFPKDVSLKKSNISSKPQRPESFLSMRCHLKLHLNQSTISDADSSHDQSSAEPDVDSDFTNLQNVSITSKPIASNDNTEYSQEEISNINGCIECVKAIPVFTAREIQEGDHVVFAGTVYDHHAIVVAKPAEKQFEIIEATNTIFGVATGVFLGRKALIGSSIKSFNFATQNLRVVAYRIRKFTRQETIKRAREFVEGDGNSSKYEYDLFENNCEHFATYCVTGRKFSIQVTKYRLTSRLFLSSGFAGISNEIIRNQYLYDHGIICKTCFEINQRLFDVTVRPIEKAEDVGIGDIIRYSYWNLWHDAVVLDINDVEESYLTCYIAHYAFCGIFSHRTITQEELTIRFNGEIKKLEYGPPKYNVYDPDIVVERAMGRLREQQFVFYSNDSSHFSRWCKLKRERSNNE